MTAPEPNPVQHALVTQTPSATKPAPVTERSHLWVVLQYAHVVPYTLFDALRHISPVLQSHVVDVREQTPSHVSPLEGVISHICPPEPDAHPQPSFPEL